MFPDKNINDTINPDEAVACGAAIQASILVGNVNEMATLIDVNPLSLGYSFEDGQTRVVIERNSSIPTKKTVSIPTTRDKQKTFEFDIIEGI